MVGAAVLTPLLGLGYYYLIAYRGEIQDWFILRDRFDDVVVQAIHRPDSLPKEAKKNLAGFTQVLQAHLLRQGMNDPDGLHLLGENLLRLQMPEQALSALAKAYRLDSQRPDIMLAYAQAITFANDGKLTDLSARLLGKVLEANPDHQVALMLLGFGAFNAGAYEKAIQAWRPVLAGRDPSSESAQLLRNSIARAEKLLSAGNTAKPPEQQTAKLSASQAKIAVSVELAPELKERISPQDTLFIFAKAASGPVLPLAVVKRAATGFPVKAVLDDSQAMAPAVKLSNFQQVVVSARISKVGDVSARPGDLQGNSATLSLADGPLSISLVIDQVIQ